MTQDESVRPDEALSIARMRLPDIVEQVQVLADDLDAQIAWLHPCGWTREEPYRHLTEHPPCAGIDELVNSFSDLWPSWRSMLAPALTKAAEDALDRLDTRLEQLDQDAFRNELETLDLAQWAEVRLLARHTLEILSRTD